jgi:hypothetical protein
MEHAVHPGSSYRNDVPDNATMIVGSFCQNNPVPACSSWEVDEFHRDTPSLTTAAYVPKHKSEKITLPDGWYDVRLKIAILDGLVRRVLGPWLDRFQR